MKYLELFTFCGCVLFFVLFISLYALCKCFAVLMKGEI